MQTDVKQVFYFHADANSLGGFLEGPEAFRYLPTPSSVSLSATGGSVASSAAEFDFEGLISCRSSYTHVSGKPAEISGGRTKINGPWTSRATAVVEGLNILGRITAERVIARIFIEQPEAGGGRKISFAGTRFDDLRLDNKPLRLSLDPTLLPSPLRESNPYNEDESFIPEIEWPTLWRTAYSQARTLVATKSTPEWGRERYGWGATRENPEEAGREGYAICSLVNRVDGVPPGQTFGHCIEIPDVGRFFLGEAAIFPFAVHLTMIRAELGCENTGQVSAATVRTNGSTCPPGLG
jgi:hypothetical protein